MKAIRILIALAAVLGLAWVFISRPQPATVQQGAPAAQAIGPQNVPVLGPSRPTAPRAGAFAPNFALKTLDDKTLSLSDLKGKVVIVNFWATWCPPCRAEMPALQAAQAEHEAQGLVVVGVNQLEDVSLVKAFQQASNYSLNFVLDSDGKTARAYNVAGLPTSFFINREGVIEHAEYGGAMTRALIESKLAPMLSQ
ncbi:MAG TPA: redoxin domain-containing protein [Thermoflexales bacterium]|nr:redoxin domain-containing protein [Thermoflexales bacterium]